MSAKKRNMTTLQHGPQAHIMCLTPPQQEAEYLIYIRPITLERGGVWENQTNVRNACPNPVQSQRCFGADASFHPRTQKNSLFLGNSCRYWH